MTFSVITFLLWNLYQITPVSICIEKVFKKAVKETPLLNEYNSLRLQVNPIVGHLTCYGMTRGEKSINHPLKLQ